MVLSAFVCDTKSTNDCESIRQYVAASAEIDANNASYRQLQLPKVPFRAFCDTFWNLASKKDENIEMCQRWWKCGRNQWQCRSDQCIEMEWVLDGEWDCIDASDEQGLFISTNLLSAHNLNRINSEKLIAKFDTMYKTQSFTKICNYSVEYPCFLANVSDPLNITQNRPCINLHQIGDGHVDCAGSLDERNILTLCNLRTMLGYHFECSFPKSCIRYEFLCPSTCYDARVQCYGYEQTSNCSGYRDFMCLDGKCAKEGWCSTKSDCSHREDELFCHHQRSNIFIYPDILYRERKELFVKSTKQNLQLPQLPIGTKGNKVTDITISMVHNESTAISFSDQINSSISYYCNRGIAVQLYNESIVCFYPPQYYGDKCQFHNDRITVLFHLNEDDPLMIESFQTRVADEIMVPRKKLRHLFYSRSNISLRNKQARYFNRSNIIDKHLYSIRIEVYELSPREKARFVGVWLYPVYFDFLPSFRLAKVLHLTKPDTIKNPCVSNPCSPKQECHQVLNQKSTYVCLCLPNFKGDNCLIKDKMCEEDFCSANALCKPNYRGSLNGNERRPYCICPLNEIGHRCGLIHDKCHPNPCQNNGTCISTSKPNQFFCLCDDYHYGDECQLKKRSVQLHINKSSSHRASVVQYFDINFFSLDLLLVHQRVYMNLPDSLQYLYDTKAAPGIILFKLYSNTQSAIYLISIQIDVESINGTTDVTEENRCVHVQTLFETKEEISPFTYHYLCIQNLSLLCFLDESYLCICDENHSLDQCSSCLNGGQCIKENRLRSNYVCLCPRCHTGKFCQFTSEFFSFTVDQLFSTNLASKRSIEKNMTIFSLIFGSCFLFLLGLLNNICSFVTFRRSKCLRTGVGYYLLWMSVINQIDLTLLALRLTHLTLNITNFRSNPQLDTVFCKLLNYLLMAFSRIPYWFVSLIAIERVYTTISLRGQWLKKPHIAKRLIMIMVSLILITGSYELYFVESHIDLNTNNGAVCTLSFPRDQRIWMNIHRIVIVIHTLVPFLINICCTMTISCIIIRKKININVRVVRKSLPNMHELETTIKESEDDTINQSPVVKEKSRLSLLCDILIENKELIIGPGVTLIPQLFSLPLFIVSIVFACQDIETSSLRCLLIISYLITFIPQVTSFFLYIYPSSLYTEEWRFTHLSKWFQRVRQRHRQDPSAMKDINKLQLPKQK